MVESPAVVQSGPAATRITSCLTLLNSPHEDYSGLADCMSRLLSELDDETQSEERTLATYFELFGHGYAEWQTCYDYHVIHEYFFGAYLRALREGEGRVDKNTLNMLGHMTDAMIAYSNCENSVICNDPKSLFHWSSRAAASGEASLEAVEESPLNSEAKNELYKYIAKNLHLFLGLRTCAAMHLAAGGGDPVMQDDHERVHRSMDFLRLNSYELFTELKSHYSIALRNLQIKSELHTDLRVDGAELLLRTMGHAQSEVVSALFDVFNQPDLGPDFILKLIHEQTDLPVVSVLGSHMQDIFETSLGEEYLKEIIFDLSSDDQYVSFSINDNCNVMDYLFKGFLVRIARLGTISVEFSLELHNVSVSHVRVLQSLVAPHAGQFRFSWRGAPARSIRGALNYVDNYDRYKKWFEQMIQLVPLDVSLVQQMADTLAKWRAGLLSVADRLPRLSFGTDSEDQDISEASAEARQVLHDAFSQMSDLVNQWIVSQVRSSHNIAVLDAGNDLQSSGTDFVRLADIAAEIYDRMTKLLKANLSFQLQRTSRARLDDSTADKTSKNQYIIHDHNTDWQTILTCSELRVLSHAGEDIGNFVAVDADALTHPDFKGLLIQNREARSSIDDWRFVEAPAYRNLALIRSHETDVFCLSANQAFLYLPDEPKYLITQYVESVRLVGDVRSLVLALIANSKRQIAELESFLVQLQRSEHDPRGRVDLRASRRSLLARRDDIELFRMKTTRTLGLLSSYTISKYQDHSDLLKAMMIQIDFDSYFESLNKQIDVLDRFHAYLTGLIQYRIDDFNRHTQGRVTAMVYLLTVLSMLSAVTAIDAFLKEAFAGFINRQWVMGGIGALLTSIIFASTAVGLITWNRSKRI